MNKFNLILTVVIGKRGNVVSHFLGGPDFASCTSASMQCVQPQRRKGAEKGAIKCKASAFSGLFVLCASASLR